MNSLTLNLAIYFSVNLSLSTSNKLVLEKSPTPWLLTCLHAVFTSVGCWICLQQQYFILTRGLTKQEHLMLLCFSCLFTINIAMSNISLSYVSLAFHQVARSTGPIFTVAIYGIWYRKVYSIPVYLAVSATSVGIGLATYGDYSCTAFGIFVTFLGMILATVKTIATNLLMTGNLKLHPLEVLLRMCPLAAAQSLLCASLTGELNIAANMLSHGLFSRSILQLVFANGVLAFAQNLSSFHTNKIAGALTIAICANMKQLCTVILAIRMFDTQVTFLSALGILVVLSVTAYYSWTVVRQKSAESAVTHHQKISLEEKGMKH